jgi:calcium-dependent protein kinase
LYETYEDSKNVYLVMECCTGGELFDRIIAANFFMERTAAHVVKQILTGVYYMHNNFIAHRDLKPENFLLANEQDVMKSPLKIIDFGLSRRYEAGVPMTTKACTPYYVAPEVLDGKYNEKCDVWSIGVIMYILLCGAPPFFGDSDPEVLRKVKKGKYDFDMEPWKENSQDAKDLINRLLVMDVNKRFTVRQALEHTWVEKLAPNSSDKNLSMAAVSNLKGFRAQNKLKKAALTVIATELSEESLKDLKDMFISLDSDNDGTLTVDEMKAGMIKAGIKDIPPNLMEIMKEVDSDGSGVIDYTEFLAATLSRKQYMQEDIVWSAFRVFDLDGDGQITREELAQVLSGERVKDVEQALQLNKEEIERIIKEVDEDGDGQISFQEFFNMMKKKEREGDKKKKKKKKKDGEEDDQDEEGAEKAE